MEQAEFMADPKQLRAEAEKEPSRRGLEDYLETIRLLKDKKGFSFREIAAWLEQHGLNTDHNAVWRTYSKLQMASNSVGSYEQIERNERPSANQDAMPWLESS
jgi:hypothetical protein